MGEITWVEVILISLFTGSLVFSVGFCINNYARRDPSELAKKPNE